MSLKEASEIVTSAPCPHCEAPQYLNVMQLGQNLVCSTCGGEYGAPAAPGARATKTLWGPRAAEPAPAPVVEEPVEEPAPTKKRSGPVLGPVIGAMLICYGAFQVIEGHGDGALYLKRQIAGIAWIVVGGFVVVCSQLSALIEKD